MFLLIIIRSDYLTGHVDVVWFLSEEFKDDDVDITLFLFEWS